ncbi:MAG TPA: winged helix-turn-helix domain-containing protein [Vicinamibacterales bacterium]|nr:winged helix-turn-helix domain-containing protein [Vicinamibacterales bacterium]
MRERVVYEFGDVQVDTGRMAARRGGGAIPLEPKAFDVLVHLIEHRDRVVAKDELLDAVWTGTFVTPNVLTRAVAQIRKALGDESQDARYVETIARRGYRFIAPVTVLPVAPSAAAPPPPPAEPPPAPPAREPEGIRRRWSWAAALALASLGLAAAVSMIGRVPPADDRESAASDLPLTRITNRRGYTANPALSPDGRSIVYASDATGALELYLVSLAPGSAEIALTKDGGHNMQPAWSPDGQWIAFHSRRRGGVWIVPSSGGVPRQIVEFGSDPAWSPDSSTIVFTSDAGGLAGQSSLWTIRRDGTGRRQLTTIGSPPGGHRAPAWSRDGRLVAFIVARGGWQMDVRTVNVATGAQALIAAATNGADPVFAPGGDALLWGGTTPSGNGRVFRHAIDADGNPVGETEVLLPMEAGIVEGLSLSSNGTLAFAARTVDANLWGTDIGPDGKGSEPVRLTDDVSRNTHPDYASDGRVAYMQTAVGAPPSVWTMRDDGSDRTPLVTGAGAGDPQWDLKHDRLLVQRGTTESGWRLLWVDLASRRETFAMDLRKDMIAPRLSPDGQSLAYHRIEESGVLSVWRAGFGGPEKKVAVDPEAVSYPAWSPDGKTLAVEIKRGDSTHIAWVPASGGPIVQLTKGFGQSWPHTWAPDNDRIAFAGQRDGVWNVYTVSRTTGAVTQVTAFKSAAGYVRYPAWHPSGSRIVFERALETANVWTVPVPSTSAGK